uniref:F-box domain-containing protein n=1 Tax=Oryza nivara TaxID=4536 RepID=A0A0E0IJB2_ORYNI
MAVRPRRRRRRSAPPRPASSRGEGDDRLSELPDELLLIVMRGLDTRSALGAAALSRRWARLPRELPALDFHVSDALQRGAGLPPARRRVPRPPRRAPRRRRRVEARGIPGAVRAPRHAGPGRAHHRLPRRRRVSRLGVEFFATNDAHRIGCVHRLINTAVGSWGVEELEVAIKPAPWRRRKAGLPVVGADMPPLRLTKLTLRNCPPRRRRCRSRSPFSSWRTCRGFRLRPPLLLSGFPHLKKLHLKNCHCRDPALVVDAPPPSSSSAVVPIQLNHAAVLEDLACVHDANPVVVLFRDVPRLRRVHLSFSLDSGTADDAQHPLPGPDKYKLDWHVRSEQMASLVLRFTGPERWILPWRVGTRLRSLRRLLVADGSPTWDVSWPRRPWSPCTRARRLRRVELLRHGEVRYDGLWEWEVVRRRPQEGGGGERRHWSRMEEIGIKR